MKFVEMTGQALKALVRDDEIPAEELERAGVTDMTVVRINEQGDLEVRRSDGWEIVGGLLGDFRSRIEHETGMRWA